MGKRGWKGQEIATHIKPANEAKPTAQPSMMDFFVKKPAPAASSSKAAAKPASKTTTAHRASGSTKSQPPPKKAPVKKVAESSDEDELLLGNPESVVPIVPRATAPRRVAAAKPAYIELSDDDSTSSLQGCRQRDDGSLTLQVHWFACRLAANLRMETNKY
jgi:hypothetical protein